MGQIAGRDDFIRLRSGIAKDSIPKKTLKLMQPNSDGIVCLGTPLFTHRVKNMGVNKNVIILPDGLRVEASLIAHM